jgi:Zn-finger nucleic acid-binding protein
MTDPYRDPHQACPACKVSLRAFRGRLVCDRCEGMFAPIADLAFAIEEITGVVPVFEYARDRPGTRPCPECGGSMIAFKLIVKLEDEVAKAAPELDRCGLHGIWFDQDELAAVFEVCRAKHPGGAGRHAAHGSAEGPRTGGWGGDQRGPFWWGGGHGNF